jgi:hypothetical protein
MADPIRREHRPFERVTDLGGGVQRRELVHSRRDAASYNGPVTTPHLSEPPGHAAKMRESARKAVEFVRNFLPPDATPEQRAREIYAYVQAQGECADALDAAIEFDIELQRNKGVNDG